MKRIGRIAAAAVFFVVVGLAATPPASAQGNKPNIVILMTGDTEWGDFGRYTGGGANLGHPTPNVDRMAKEGATFTSQPDLQHPENPLPLLDPNNLPKVVPATNRVCSCRN
jgi:hypothetical protein